MRSFMTVRQVSEILTSCCMSWQGCQTYIDVSHARILTCQWITFRAQLAVTRWRSHYPVTMRFIETGTILFKLKNVAVLKEHM